MDIFKKGKFIFSLFFKFFKFFFDLIFAPFRVYFIFLVKRPIIFGIVHAFLIICFYFLFHFFVIKELPNLDKLENYNPPLETQFFDRNNNLIYKISNERRVYNKINEIPKNLINAFLSAEDKTFFENPGFDILGTIKILILDVKKIIKREKLAGASTITQQLARNLFLSSNRDNFIKLILRKIREIVLAYKITKNFDKNKILEIYLNQISFGNNAFGVGVASEVYFGKNVSNINLQEAALIASLPKGPSHFNPYKYYERAKLRRDWILEKMFDNKFITKEQFTNAKNSEIDLNFERNKNQIARNACWFAKDIAINYLKSKDLIQNDSDFLNNGYKVKLTIDSEIQRIAQNEFDEHLLYLERFKNEYSPVHFDIKFENIEDFQKNWNNKLRKINNEFSEILDIAFVLDVTEDNVLIGLKNNTLNVIPLENMLWAKKSNTFKCNEILKNGDLIYVKKDREIINPNFYQDLFKKNKIYQNYFKFNNKKEEKANVIGKNFEYFYSLMQIPHFNGGGTITNPKNGDILALIGGFVDLPGTFNRAINSNRQIGSTIKPFVYSVGLEQFHLKPSDIFMDSELNLDLGNGVVWSPRNHDRMNRGPLTLRSGIENSRNTVTIRLMEKIGISKIVKFLEKLKFSDKKIESNYSIGIGAIEGSPLSVARAYSIFVNDGKMQNLAIISSIKDKNDKELLNEPILLTENNFTKNIFKKEELNNNDDYILENPDSQEISDKKKINEDLNIKNQEIDSKETENKAKQDLKNEEEAKLNEIEKLISPQTAYQMYSFLEGATKRGSGFGLNELKIPMGVKTGTSDKGRDLWTVAVSNNLCLSFYTGYDIPQDTDMFGVKGAFPIIKHILMKMKSFYKIDAKIPPDGLKFVKINLQNGKRTKKPISRSVIYEIFKKEDDINEIPEETEEDNEDILNDF